MKILNREQLIDFIADASPIKAVRRAITESGKVENLGMFTRMYPDFQRMGWVVRVTSKTGKNYYACVIRVGGSDKFKSYRCVIKDKEPDWRHWDGVNCNTGLFTGDNPKEYKGKVYGKKK